MQLPACPKCNCEYTYEDGEMLICPECAYEWSQNSASTAENAKVIKDAHGTVLADGDTVVVIKDLKLKVQASIRGDVVRVEGKSIDDLQEAIKAIRECEFDFPVNFTNLK